MFEKLFAESGLSLDRLRTMLEVGATGSIAKAAAGDPVRQSQYSRQIRELEDFFRVKLVERQGKGMQLTVNGRELARISRFFLLGLSNFQRGCLSEDQTFRIAACSTVLHHILTPVLSTLSGPSTNRYALEAAADNEIERRLHDLTLDFAVVSRVPLSRPLQTKEVGISKLMCLVPHRPHRTRQAAGKAFKAKSLPLALSKCELDPVMFAAFADIEPHLACDSFLSALVALESQHWAAILPEMIIPSASSRRFWHIPIPGHASHRMRFYLAWNPRLLRLNPHVARTRDLLITSLMTKFAHPGPPLKVA